MAIREQRGRKRPFFVYYKNPFTGAMESKSCETKEEAEKLDAFIKYQLKYERDSFRRSGDHHSQQIVQTLESVFYLYLRERNFSLPCLERTMSASKAILQQYGDIEIAKVSKEILAEMKGSMLAKGNKPTTIRRKLGIVQTVLRWAHRNGYINELPLFPPMPMGQHARFIPPTPDEVSKLYDAAPEHLRRVVVLGYYFGMRVGACELLRLKWADVDIHGGIMRVPNAQKGNDEPWREIPIREDIKPLLLAWQMQDREQGIDYVVTYHGKPVRKIKTAWAAALRRAGITRHIRPYDLRHGFATEAIAAGVDYGTVAALMGHKSPVMVLQHYQHVRNAQKKAAMDALPRPPQYVQVGMCKQ